MNNLYVGELIEKGLVFPDSIRYEIGSYIPQFFFDLNEAGFYLPIPTPERVAGVLSVLCRYENYPAIMRLVARREALKMHKIYCQMHRYLGTEEKKKAKRIFFHEVHEAKTITWDRPYYQGIRDNPSLFITLREWLKQEKIDVSAYDKLYEQEDSK